MEFRTYNWMARNNFYIPNNYADHMHDIKRRFQPNDVVIEWKIDEYSEEIQFIISRPMAMQEKYAYTFEDRNLRFMTFV